MNASKVQDPLALDSAELWPTYCGEACMRHAILAESQVDTGSLWD
jgi:hypothetical protein